MNEPWNIFADSERNLSIIASSLYFYVLVVALVRLMGKRTTAQMNNFDWIINVAVGSLVARYSVQERSCNGCNCSHFDDRDLPVVAHLAVDSHQSRRASRESGTRLVGA